MDYRMKEVEKMKCPKCKGKGRILIPTIMVGEIKHDDCSHCDNTGEIQDDDWWMCRHHKTGSELPYMWDAGMNAWWYAGHYMDISDVAPICRMKEAE
ncbi:MAG TPA: hypothetical protein VMX17_03430 [Candidatus Glassbacteria bacterium]|nr:hypothetical protein [Candidatus Glassbacteria bacterium]